jgi:hypothetical protein
MLDQGLGDGTGSRLGDVAQVEPSRPRRPSGVTHLAWLLLLVAGWNLARFGQSLVQWSVLSELLPFSPYYPAISGAVWGVSGLVLSWGIWRGLPWVRRLYWLYLGAYTLYFWIDRIVLAGYPGRNQNWPFLASVNLLVWAYSLWIMSRKKTRTFFGEVHEREPKNSTIA